MYNSEVTKGCVEKRTRTAVVLVLIISMSTFVGCSGQKSEASQSSNKQDGYALYKRVAGKAYDAHSLAMKVKITLIDDKTYTKQLQSETTYNITRENDRTIEMIATETAIYGNEPYRLISRYANGKLFISDETTSEESSVNMPVEMMQDQLHDLPAFPNDAIRDVRLDSEGKHDKISFTIKSDEIGQYREFSFTGAMMLLGFYSAGDAEIVAVAENDELRDVTYNIPLKYPMDDVAAPARLVVEVSDLEVCRDRGA
jgi:hypothetical protein